MMTKTEKTMPDQAYIRWFADLNSNDVAQVGGKNASLGEMLQALQEQGIRVPDGFATTAAAYRAFLAANALEDRIREQLQAFQQEQRSLMEFIINNVIKIHPMALVHFDDLDD